MNQIPYDASVGTPTQVITRIVINRHFLGQLNSLRTPLGQPLGEQLKARLTREFDRLALATEQIRSLQMQQAAMIRQAAKEVGKAEKERNSSRVAIIAEHLCQLSGIGPVTAWTLATEIFSWRDIARDVKSRRVAN